MHLCGNIQRQEMPNVPVAFQQVSLPAGTVKRGEKEGPEYPITPA